jgi:hypothetical protein
MRALVLTLLAALAAQSAPVLAADDEAGQHFDAGIALVQKHDFTGALAELERSYAARPLPETLFDDQAKRAEANDLIHKTEA